MQLKLFSFCSSLLLTTSLGGALAQDTETAARTVPFETAMYGLFVTPYPDLRRSYVTSTLDEVRRRFELPPNLATPPGYTLLGTWTTVRTLSSSYGPTPSALFLFTRSAPTPPNSTQSGSAIAVSIGRWSPTTSVLQEYRRKRAADATYTKTNVGGGIIFSFCRDGNIVAEDYPLLARSVRTYCEATYRTSTSFVDVTVVNLDERRAIVEVGRVATALNLVGGK